MALTVNITGGMDLDQGGQVDLSATVTENGNPPLGTLAYTWSASRGSFIGATDQASVTYQADFSDSSDVDVTITCDVTRAAETNPTIASASLSSMAQLGITNPILNMYVTNTEQGTNGSYTVWWQTGSADSDIDANSDSELSSDLTISIIQWNPTADRFSLNSTGAGNLSSFFSSNTTQSVYVILNDGSYYEITNAMYGNGGGNWVRWDLTDATLIAAFNAVGDNTTLTVGVADAGSIGWAADSGSGTAMFAARAVLGTERRLLHQSQLPAAQNDNALIPVAIQDPNDANNVLTYRFTKDELITFVVGGIEALTGDDRLDTNSLKNPFKVGDLTTTVAIADNDRLVFSDTSETGRPNRYTTFGSIRSTIRPSIQDEGVVILGNPEFLNFIGGGVDATVDGTGVDINVAAATVNNITNVFNQFTNAEQTVIREAIQVAEGQINFTLLGTYDLVATNDDSTGITYVSNIDEVWAVDSVDNTVYRYNTSGVSQGTYSLNAGNTSATGIAYVSDVSEVWVVDSVDRDFYRYNTSGVSQGTYPIAVSEGNGNPVGLTFVSETSVNEVWCVDTSGIYRYNTSGTYQGTYSLNSNNDVPSGIAYISSISEVWVSDSNDELIYRYNTSGTFLGTYTLAPSNTQANGITYVSTVDQIWIVDNTADEIFYYNVQLTVDINGLIGAITQMSAAQRTRARVALGLEAGPHFQITVANNRPTGDDVSGDIVIAYTGALFQVGTTEITLSAPSDCVIINYT